MAVGPDQQCSGGTDADEGLPWRSAGTPAIAGTADMKRVQRDRGGIGNFGGCGKPAFTGACREQNETSVVEVDCRILFALSVNQPKMRCTRARPPRRPIRRNRGFFDWRAVIDDGVRVVQLAELLSLREELLALLGDCAAYLLSKGLAPRGFYSGQRARIFEQPARLRHAFGIEDALVTVALRDRFALSLVGIEQAISRLPTKLCDQFPHKILTVLNAAVHAEAAMRREAVRSIACQEHTPAAPLFSNRLIVLPMQNADDLNRERRIACRGSHDLGTPFRRIDCRVFTLGGLEVEEP